jgi:hypothetical protein
LTGESEAEVQSGPIVLAGGSASSAANHQPGAATLPLILSNAWAHAAAMGAAAVLNSAPSTAATDYTVTEPDDEDNIEYLPTPQVRHLPGNKLRLWGRNGSSKYDVIFDMLDYHLLPKTADVFDIGWRNGPQDYVTDFSPDEVSANINFMSAMVRSLFHCNFCGYGRHGGKRWLSLRRSGGGAV